MFACMFNPLCLPQDYSSLQTGVNGLLTLNSAAEKYLVAIRLCFATYLELIIITSHVETTPPFRGALAFFPGLIFGGLAEVYFFNPPMLPLKFE